MECHRLTGTDGMACVASCPPGYAFSGPVFPIYVCGSSTQYRWPHETPDNPRCIIPACARTRPPDQVVYQFHSSIDIPCTSSKLPTELLHMIDDTARHLTKYLRCMRHNTCTLRTPNVKCCDPQSSPDRQLTETRQTNETSECEDLTDSTRRKRDLSTHSVVQYADARINKHERRAPTDRSVMIDIELLYHGQTDQGQTDPVGWRYATDDVGELGERLLRETRAGRLRVHYDHHKVTPQVNQTRVLRTVICPRGTAIANNGLECVECSPGSYYDASERACVPCDVGYYQPRPAQSHCHSCPATFTTPARAATLPQQCYRKGTPPPAIPMELYADLGAAGWIRIPTMYQILSVAAISILTVLVTVLIVMMAHKRRNTSSKTDHNTTSI